MNSNVASQTPNETLDEAKVLQPKEKVVDVWLCAVLNAVAALDLPSAARPDWDCRGDRGNRPAAARLARSAVGCGDGGSETGERGEDSRNGSGFSEHCQ